jgi:predicted PurR-regulated permease PerM
MTPPESDPPPSGANAALAPLLWLASLALGWILLPFYGTLLWGAIIALLFAPLHRGLLRRLGGKPTLAALLTLMVALWVVVLPLVLVSAALAREGLQVYARLSDGSWNPALDLRHFFDVLPGWIRTPLDRAGLNDFDVLQRRAVTAAAQGSQWVATRAFSIGQDTFAFVVDLLLTTYIAFFLIRDGEALAVRVQRALPLAPQHKAVLVDKFSTVIRATVKGGLLVATIQGALGGLAFWFLGVKAALLWGALMAFMALVPAVGAALVWLPLALYLMFTGSLGQGIALVVFGVLVIGLIDNVLRPMLVGKDTRMPDSVVMITTLGGLAVLGLNGLVLGPAIAALFMAVWHIQLTALDQRPDENP